MSAETDGAKPHQPEDYPTNLVDFIDRISFNRTVDYQEIVNLLVGDSSLEGLNMKDQFPVFSNNAGGLLYARHLTAPATVCFSLALRRQLELDGQDHEAIKIYAGNYTKAMDLHFFSFVESTLPWSIIRPNIGWFFGEHDNLNLANQIAEKYNDHEIERTLKNLYLRVLGLVRDHLA